MHFHRCGNSFANPRVENFDTLDQSCCPGGGDFFFFWQKCQNPYPMPMFSYQNTNNQDASLIVQCIITPMSNITFGFKIFTSSSINSFLARSTWNLWPQFLTHVSSTWITKRITTQFVLPLLQPPKVQICSHKTIIPSPPPVQSTMLSPLSSSKHCT